MCSDCEAARLGPTYRRYDPRCLYCGARYFQSLRTFPTIQVKVDVSTTRDETKEERKAWMSKVLDTWAKYGHDRTQLRDLAMGATVPYAGDQPAPADALAAPPVAKRKKR